MAEQKVVLFVRSQQFYPEGDPDDVELMTEGVMDAAGGAITLTYRETELTGMEGTVTRFTIRDNAVTLERTGAVSSAMVFEKGRAHSSLYDTPWGTLLVDVATTSLAHRLTERGGVLELKYTVSVDHRMVSENHVKIRVRESKREIL